MRISKVISKNLSWIESMHGRDGYYGPVIHYWRKNLEYTGPGYDWRYEGLIQGYLNLYQKFEKKKFLEKAINCGNELVNAQLNNGFFPHSKFECNPSFRGGDCVHEAGASIGLLELSKVLKKEGRESWKKYYKTAEKNIKNLHIKTLYDKKVKTFYQYPLRKRFVFNKISSVIEALIKLYELNQEEQYLQMAVHSGEFILEHQNEDGSIPQELEEGESLRIVTYYNARSIPSLIQLFEKTKKEKFLNSAIKLGEFVKKMRLPSGGYKWGFKIKNSERIPKKYPLFIAGSADIIRGLNNLKPFNFKYEPEKDIKWLIQNTLANGGVKSIKERREKCINRIPVVGWNDKVLRLYSEIIERKEEVPKIRKLESMKEKCETGFYEENADYIKIEDNTHKITFNKGKVFPGKTPLITRSIYYLAKVYSTIPRPKILDKILSKLYFKIWNS